MSIFVAWLRNGPHLVLTGVVINDDFSRVSSDFEHLPHFVPLGSFWMGRGGVVFEYFRDLVLKVSKMSTRGSMEAPEATEGTEATQVSHAGDRGRAASVTIATKSD